MGHCSTADDDRHDDPDLSHVQPETGDSEVCDENDQSGLPEPQEYDRPYFDVFDYLSNEYADARNLNEAIDMRGQKAFAQSVTPDDFRDASPDNMTNWVLPNCGPNRGGMMADPRAISRWSSSLPTFTRETCWKSVVVPRKSALGDTRSIVWMTTSCCHIPPTMISTTGSFLECWTTCPKTDG